MRKTKFDEKMEARFRRRQEDRRSGKIKKTKSQKIQEVLRALDREVPQPTMWTWGHTGTVTINTFNYPVSSIPPTVFTPIVKKI